jgi:succinate-semialdehyde dehydrogenase/glutarate-semialdehyde dehydrogenase
MFKSVNPATDQEITTYAELTEVEIDARLTRAASTFALWRKTPVADRVALLNRLADAYSAHKNDLARMATLEMGKTLASAIAEIEKCVAAFRYYAEHGPAMLDVMRYDLASGGRAELYWQPLGCVLAVMPWNFPYWQVVRFLAPAILAGNTGLLKHASNVQGVAGLMEEMMRVAGAPEGLFQNLAVMSKAINAIIADPRIAAVTLTGSEGAGRAVAEQAGKCLKKTLLELGGSDPFIVMPSANLNEAVRQAVKARIQNTGQSCICGKRMIVHTDIYDTFLEKFSTAMHAVKAGDPMNPATAMGPLSSLNQRKTVLDQIAMASKLGAKLIGGEAQKAAGAFMSAGILIDGPREGAFLNEEIFGPVALLYRAASIDEAIALANAVPYGLGSSVWTEDKNEQSHFIGDIDAGMMAINQMLASAPDAPFGGIKHSGYGRELGPFGLREFMNLKTVLWK